MNLKHYDHDGRARFVTFCTHKKIPIMTNSQFMDIVQEAIDDGRKSAGFKLIAYVIMPEHVHLVIHPRQDSKLGYIIGEIKRRSSKRIHSLLKARDRGLIEKLTVMRNKKPRFSLWQRRCYDHNCRSEDSVWRKVNYCHNNPVKRGLVKNPEDWRWSSYQFYQAAEVELIEIDFSG